LPYHAYAAKIVIVQRPGANSISLSPRSISWLESFLQPRVKVVSFLTYYQAGAKAGVESYEITDPTYAVVLSQVAGNSHVLFLSTSLRNARAKSHLLQAELVDGRTGETVWEDRYVLQKSDLGAAFAKVIAQQVLGALVRQARLYPPPPSPSVTEKPAVSPAPAPAQVPSGSLPPKKEEAKEPKVAIPSPNPVKNTPNTLPSEIAPKPRWKFSMPKKAEKDAYRWLESALEWNAGGLFYSRTATLSSRENANLPCFCARRRPQPIFWRGAMDVAVYPVLFVFPKHWTRGFGLHWDGSLGNAKVLGLGTNSLVWNTHGALSWRWLVGQPKINIRLEQFIGYGAFGFPLRRGSFPSTGYKSFFLKWGLHVPFQSWGEAFLHGAWRFRVVTSQLLPNYVLGVQTRPGYGFSLATGLRFSPARHVVVRTAFMADVFSVRFGGISQLANVEPQGTQLRLWDKHFTGLLTLGYSY
jgi:hypothetical protein